MRASTQSNWLEVVRVYLFGSAVFHFAWEVVQLPLYTIWRTGSWGEIGFAVIHCTGGDLMIASLTLLVALVVFGSHSWPDDTMISVVVTTLVLGVGYTVYSEWLNTAVRKSWSYTDMMPLVPGLGTGLSPLLQWVIVPSLAFALAVRVGIRPV